MSKYWEIFKVTWQGLIIYRVNFMMWRIRTVLQLLLVYFIWWSVFQARDEVFGYTTTAIITYVLIAALIRAIVMGTKVTDLIDSINTGRVVNFLIKPIGFVRYYLTREAADKLFNIIFFIIEISIIFFLLKPPLFIQTDILNWVLFLFAISGALIISFCINFLISLTAFWLEYSWGVLFLMSIFLESLGGGLFPIDILPKSLFSILMLTPFPYLIYFPAKLYLGSMGITEIATGFSVTFVWIIILVFLTRKVLNAGFRHFSSVGH